MYGSDKKYIARYNEKKVAYPVQDRLMNIFCETLARLKTKKAIRNFLKDLLNRQEHMTLLRRLLIAELLLDDKTHQEIQEKLHCGTSTIAKVERWF